MDYLERPVRGAGRSEVVHLPAGLAISGIAYQLPGAVDWTIESVCVRLTTSGVAGNRRVNVELSDGSGATVFRAAAPGVQGPNASVTYTFGHDLTANGSAADFFMTGPFIGARLPGNLTLEVLVASVDAGDTFDSASVIARQHSVT